MLTLTCGGASSGYCATGIVGIAIAPARMRTSEQTEARIGRRMKVSTNIYCTLTGAPSASFWMPEVTTRSPAFSPPLTT